MLRQVVDELANVLQSAIGLSARLRRDAQMTADDAVALEGGIDRAVSALKRLQPPTAEGGR